MRRFLATLSAIVLFTPWALADDLYPPDWRGEPRTTFEHWGFGSDQGTNWIPELYDNPYGSPYAYTGGGAETWLGSWQGRQGVLWISSDTLYLHLPNHPEPNDEKIIQLQVTFWEDPSYQYPTDHPYVSVVDPNGTSNDRQITFLGNGWHHTVWDITIPENPPYEVIALDPWSGRDMYIDQIVVDTWCVPEPTTIELLIVGSLFVIKRRR